jgi:hypothetical protein
MKISPQLGFLMSDINGSKFEQMAKYLPGFLAS